MMFQIEDVVIDTYDEAAYQLLKYLYHVGNMAQMYEKVCDFFGFVLIYE